MSFTFRPRALPLAASAGLACLLLSSAASALPLVSLSASLRGVHGTATEDLEPSPYGFGVGARAGVTLPLSLHVGASYDYFFGGSATVMNVDTSASSQQIMGVLGYDLSFALITLRPQLGVGYLRGSTEVEDTSASEGNFVLAPGVDLTLGLGLIDVGAEVRYNKVFVDDGAPSVDGVVLGLGLGLSI